MYQQQFTNSKIFNTKNQMASMIQYIGTGSQWRLCYSGVVHGWASTTFHSNCDNQGLDWSELIQCIYLAVRVVRVPIGRFDLHNRLSTYISTYLGLASMTMVRTTNNFVYGFYTITQWNGNYGTNMNDMNYKNFMWR